MKAKLTKYKSAKDFGAALGLSNAEMESIRREKRVIRIGKGTKFKTFLKHQLKNQKLAMEYLLAVAEEGDAKALAQAARDVIEARRGISKRATKK